MTERSEPGVNLHGGGRDDARVIELEIPSDVQEIEKVVELVQRECALMKFGARQLMLNLAVALTEALSNAILRGNNDDPAKHVYVTARVDSVRLVLEVMDEGGASISINAHSIRPRPTTWIERTAAGCSSCVSSWIGSNASTASVATSCG